MVKVAAPIANALTMMLAPTMARVTPTASASMLVPMAVKHQHHQTVAARAFPLLRDAANASQIILPPITVRRPKAIQ